MFGFAPRVGPGLFSLPAGFGKSLLGFAPIFASDRAGRVPQILGRFARVHFATFEFVLRIRRSRRSM